MQVMDDVQQTGTMQALWQVVASRLEQQACYMSAQGHSAPITIWDAYCHHITEPSALAMTLFNSLTAEVFDRVTILVTGHALPPTAGMGIASGRYSKEHYQHFPYPSRQHYFTEHDGTYVLDERLQRHIDFCSEGLSARLVGDAHLDLVVFSLDRIVDLHARPEAMLREMHRMLAIGGYLIVRDVAVLPEMIYELFVPRDQTGHLFQKPRIYQQEPLVATPWPIPVFSSTSRRPRRAPIFPPEPATRLTVIRPQ